MDKRPSANLYEKIIARINYENKLLILKKQLFGYLAVFLLSLGLFLPALLSLIGDLRQSGLPQIISLIFTDFSLVAANITDFSLSILESMPAISFALVVSVFVALIFSFSKFFISFSDFRKIKLAKHLWI